MKKLIRDLARSDRNLFLVEGEKITKEADLVSQQDDVHLGIKGAASFAELFAEELKELNIDY